MNVKDIKKKVAYKLLCIVKPWVNLYLFFWWFIKEGTGTEFVIFCSLCGFKGTQRYISERNYRLKS